MYRDFNKNNIIQYIITEFCVYPLKINLIIFKNLPGNLLKNV